MKPYLLLTDDQTFAFSAENPTGTRGGVPGTGAGTYDGKREKTDE